ncbi:MAG: cobalamin-binding protein [Cyanophyceae cyanobacterium]
MSANHLRIISLLPSATEIVAALGLTDQLVGRSHECDYPPEVQDLPICTEASLNAQKPSAEIDADVQSLVKAALSLYQIKTDVVDQLQPTHIVTQDQCDVCAVSFGDVQKAVKELIHSQPEIISLQPNVLVDVWADMERVAQALGVEAKPALDKLQSRIDACREKTQNLPHIPRVATFEWTDPPMAAGNWIPELVKLAGGEPLFGAVGERSPYLEWENVVKADPEMIVVLPCGFDLERTRQETLALTKQPGWSELQAVKAGKVFIADGNAYFNRPGPRLVDSLEILAEIIHPELFNFGYRGTGWENFETSH